MDYTDEEGERGLSFGERAENAIARIPSFAPGPSDSRWPAILAEHPDLAPALKSQIRGVADGVPDWLDRAMSERTKRLRALGNAVVPQVAEYIGRCILRSIAPLEY